MAFRPSLEALLHLRQALERQEEQKLARISRSVVRLRAELEHLDSEFAENQRHWRSDLGSGNLATALHFGVTCAAALREAHKRLRQALQEAERQRKEQLELYRAARQRREVLASLVARQRAAYEERQAHRQQQALDEMHLFRLLALGAEPTRPED